MAEEKVNSRLEAFCDAVFAIAITLLVIDIKIPSPESINNTNDFWLAIKHISPSIAAFILSFIIIFITWVNHHAFLKLVSKSSASFIYANGLLLLTVAAMPFPTSLMGEYVLTDHAAPAVILYNGVIVFQALGWIFLTSSVLKNKLYKNEKAEQSVRQNKRFGYFAISLYSLCAVIAFWFPLTIAVITIMIWIFWLIYGINIKHND